MGFLPSIPDITQNPKSPTAVWVQHNITQENKKGVGRGVRPVDAVTSIKVYNENIEHGAVTILSQQLDTIMYGVKGH